MHKSDDPFWDKLNGRLSFALHELLFLPSCCAHLLASAYDENVLHKNVLHRPGNHEDAHHEKAHRENGHEKSVDQSSSVLGSASGDSARGAAVIVEPHRCRKCGDDIISRVHMGDVHKAARTANISFHDWLINEPAGLDLYDATPHPSGFEQNVSGMNDEHLQRVEQYWYDHQLENPTCAARPAHFACASPADWHNAQEKAQKEAEQAI